MFASSNPVLSDHALERVRHDAVSSDLATVQGAVFKSFALGFICIGVACFSWQLAAPHVELSLSAGASSGAGYGLTPIGYGLFLGGLLGGLVLGLVTSFAPRFAPVTAPLYAIAEGAFLGALSAIFEARYGGIVVQAALITLTTLMAMLMLYKAGVIRATARFRAVMSTLVLSVALVYLVSLVASLFGISIPYLHASAVGGSSWIGIGINLAIAGIAAFSLILDFDAIESAAASGLPRSFEWYAAFGLLVTLVWLYIEVLRLLSRLRSR